MNTTKNKRSLCVAFAISASLMASVQAQNAAVTVNVDASAGKHSISPWIYGVAFANTAQLSELNAPIDRYGGNTSSSYNWQLNASNHANDWYFESIAENSSTPGELGDTFLANNNAGGAQSMITIPMLDWVAKVGSGRSKLASFSQAKYGAQQDADWQWFSDAGNGVLASNGQNVSGNDPNDASTPSSATTQKSWVQHLVSTWGLAANGGLKYYILDNEHSIWHSTHRDVHPVGATEGEIRQKMIDYSNMIKSVDPGALVVGPEEWGWSGYFYSGYDQQYGAAHGWNGVYPDRQANGNMDYMPWLLDQLHKYDLANGTHVLDVFSLHIYPQGGEFSDNVSTAMQQLRNRSTRSLWDPTYVDASWIGDKVDLIPRMKNWVSTYYPGLKIGITEYNWGAEGHINGATTQADIYGIFGREGVDYATRWTTPDPSTPTYKAMKMYRNYDGANHGFGDMSVSATAPNPDTLSAFAATRSSDGALTVMVISKVLSGTTPVTVHLANFNAAGAAHAWQLTSANAIAQIADVPVNGSDLSMSALPAQSITMLVVPASGAANLPPTVVEKATPTAGIAPLNVAFSSAGSADSDGSIVSYAWTFGDGASSNAANPNHAYAAPGTYHAKLTVTDNLGAASKKTLAIVVTDGSGPIAAPSNLKAKLAAGGKVTLTWTDNSNNEEGFEVFRGKSPSNSFASVGTVAANTRQFIQTGVNSGTYVYRVRAYNNTTGKHSAHSNEVMVTVK
jgi:PKD repeat protein